MTEPPFISGYCENGACERCVQGPEFNLDGRMLAEECTHGCHESDQPDVAPGGASTAVAHLAGPSVEFHSDEGPILRQRCSWCGTALLDVNLARIAVPIEQAGEPYPVWEVGAFVERAGQDEAISVCMAVDWEPETPVPANACLRMPPEVTG